jgi:Secretion system C-terminal sorting domain/Beta-propeller repeat
MKKYLFLLLAICISQLMVLSVSASNAISNASGRSNATDGSGNVYMTGGFSSASITFGTITLTNAASGYMDMFIVKYDANGNVLWAKSAGGSNTDGPGSIATDGSGNVYVIGTFRSSSITFGTITLTFAGGMGDMFIVKYDSSGTVLWATSAGGSDYDNPHGIATDGGGNVYVTGGFLSPSITFGTTTLTNATSGYEDMFIVKYTASGNVLWAKRAGGSSNDMGYSIATDGSGNVFVTGSFLSSSITFGTITLSNTNGNTGDGDMFIAKYDPDSNVPWAKCAGGISTGHGKPKSANAGINDPTTNEIIVYPNPTSGKVIVSTAGSQSAITSISVFNMAGKEVNCRKSAVGSNEVTVDLSDQAKGIYILLIKAGENLYKRKIIVE